MRKSSFVVIAALAVVVSPRAARADGGYIEPTATTESDVAIEMVDQRALLWVGAETSELWLQNTYRGSAPSVGWVIPIPHLPTVECVDDRLLDALDYETAPMFAERFWSCGSSGDGFGCFSTASSRGDATLGDAADVRGGAAVTEWPVPIEGCPGMAVVTTIDGDALVAWLMDHGYPVDEPLAQLFLGYASRGWVFLVGEIAPDPISTQANTTLRIRWPRLINDPVVYPMALTGATAKIALDVRLYIAGTGLYLPKNYPSSRVPPRTGDYPDHNAESYAEALDWTLAQPGGTWAIEYASGLFERYSSCPSGDTEACAEDELNEVESPFEITVPDWLGEIRETSEPWAALTEDTPRITRLTATLSPEKMLEDVVLEPALIESFEPTFLTDYPCNVDPPGEDVASAFERHLALDPFLVLGLVGGVAFRRRQRRAALALLALAFAVLAAGCGHDWEGRIDLRQTELCDGVDNDRDGRIDELWPLLGEECTSGVGACGVAGLWSCTAAGDGVYCAGESGQPGAEACNGIDDDCDGVCDDGFACCYMTYSPCTNACGHFGGAYCDDGCVTQPCQADPPELFSETALPFLGPFFAVGEIDGDPGEEMVSAWVGTELQAFLSVYGAEGLQFTSSVGSDYAGELMRLLDGDADGVDETLVFGVADGTHPGIAGLVAQDGAFQEEWRIVGPSGPDGPGETVHSSTQQIWMATFPMGGTEPAIALVSRETDRSAVTLWILRDGASPESATLVTDAEYEPPIDSAWAADFDGDGSQDLLIGPPDYEDPPVDYLLFDEAALSGASSPVTVSIVNALHPEGFADLDHDGAAEILSPSSDGIEGHYDIIDIPSGSSLGQIQSPGEGGYPHPYIGVADLDGDGFDELSFVSLSESGEDTYKCTLHVATEPSVEGGFFQLGPLHEVTTPLDEHGEIASMELDGRPGRDLLLQAPCSSGECWKAVLSPAGCAAE